MACFLEMSHWTVGMRTSHGKAARRLQFAGRQPSNITFSVSHTLRSADRRKQVIWIRADRVRRACAYRCRNALATHRRTRCALKRFADRSQPTVLGVLSDG